MSSPKQFFPTALKISRQQYDLMKSEYYKNLPFNKAKGHINPYTRTKIESWHDYELYGHCYVLKQKTEDYVAGIEQRYKSTNDKLTRDLNIAKCDISELKKSRKKRTLFFSLVVALLCLVFFVVVSVLPSISDYNNLLNELSVVKEENKELLSSAATAYERGRSDGYSAGYKNSKKYSYSSSSSSNLNGRENPDPISSGYIGNAKSKKFHLPTCGTLPDQNNQISFSSRDDAINSGYVPCKRCDP